MAAYGVVNGLVIMKNNRLVDVDSLETAFDLALQTLAQIQKDATKSKSQIVIAKGDWEKLVYNHLKLTKERRVWKQISVDFVPEPEKEDFKLEPDGKLPTQQIWTAYREAYRNRYNTEPVRNQKVNSQVKQLVERLGIEAPAVAEFYLSHNGRYYVEKCHSVGCLLADAEKLRTEWATGRRVTNAQAQQADKSQSNLDQLERMRQYYERHPSAKS